MKKSITLITLLAGAVGAYAQGTLIVGDYGNNFTIDVFAPQVATPGTEVTGQSSVDQPVGTTVYTGVPLGGSATGSGPSAYGNGANYTVALFAAPGVNNTAGLAASEAGGVANAIFTSLFQTSGGTGLGNAGAAGNDSAGLWALNLSSGAKTSFPSGYTGGATLQLEAWYSGSGNTYAQDVAQGLPAGISIVGEITALGGTGSPPATTPTLGASGITSFSLTSTAGSTPEPSTIALGVIGASAFLFRRRK